MPYGKRYGGREMNMTSSKTGKSAGDGYSKTSEDKSYGSHGANVTESRLEKREGYYAARKGRKK